jgi:hypothetical protein
MEDPPRIVQVQQRQPNTVERSGGRLPHPVYSMSQPSAVSIGGGDRPILPASHQAPSRASSGTV